LEPISFMNSFDSGIIRFLNGFVGRSQGFDSMAVLMGSHVLLKGGIIVVLFWWALGKAGAANSNERQLLIFGLIASPFAVLVARILALTLPFRARPLHNPLLDFRVPHSLDPRSLIDWSSFPSDHAVVFSCLAMSLWLVSRRLGAVAFAYVLLGVSFPRVYLGIHYPTDMLAGAGLGIAIASLAKVDWLRNKVTRPVLCWGERHPGPFSALLFLCSFETAEEYDFVRLVGLSGYHGLRNLVTALR
jgi:undecaprenyl-diphosphatase